MGGVIHRRSWTIQQLVEVYDRQPDFKNGIGPVSQVSLQNLSPYSSALLSIFAFCTLGNIPQSLLEPENLRHLPESQWFADTEKLSQAIEELQTLSLVKKDRGSCTLSIHWLIPSYFLEFLGAVERQKAHDMTSGLLIWLSRKDKRTCMANGTVAASSFSILLLSKTVSEWSKSHEFTEMEDMCVVTKDPLSTRNEEALMDMSFALQSYLGQMYLRCGWPKKALVCLLESLRIRLHDENGDLQEVSWSEHNIAQAHLANGGLETGFEWHQRCRKTWEQWGDLQPKTVDVSFDQSMQASMARCLLYMG